MHMSNAIGSSRKSNPSRRICHLRAVPLGHVADKFVSLFVFNRREKRCRLSFIFEATTGKFVSEQTRQVSSAKSLGLQLMGNGKSLMYNKKRRGPNIEP